MEFIWHSGNWDSEISFTIMDPMGDTLINVISASDLDDLDFFTHTSNSTCQSNNPCLSPNFLNAGNITPNSANLLWQAGGNETSWNLEWGISGFNLGSGTLLNGLNSTNYSLNSLSNNTSYDFYVQANCSNSNVSFWRDLIHLTPITFLQVLHVVYLLYYFTILTAMVGMVLQSMWLLMVKYFKI